MISKKLLVGLLFVNLSVYAQKGNVGINTSNPGTTLDINGAITTRESSLAVTGNAATIPSNVSQVQLTGTATGTVAISAPNAPNAGQRLIVYNNTTGGFGATLNGTTIPNGKIQEFVFTNSSWRSTASDTGAASANIYTADGSLTRNRIVTQGANTLTFTGNKVNAFSVDGSTISVDAANHLFGVGTTNPDTKLTVQTADNSFGISHSNGTVNLKTYIGKGAAYLGTTTANDLNLTTNNTSKVTVTSSGNVGIATNNPDTKLTVQTPDNSFGISHNNGSVNLKTYIGGGSAYIGTTTANALNLTSNNASRVSITPNGNVGINTNTPDRTLDVNGNVRIHKIDYVNSAANYGIVVADGGGAISQINPDNFMGSLKIPESIFHAEQNSSLSASLSGNGADHKVVFSSVNINKPNAGTWNSANNTYTVAKTGIYQIVAGVRLENTNSKALYTLYINTLSPSMGTWVFPGTHLLGDMVASGGTYVKLLNAGAVIYCSTRTGSAFNYTQGPAFMHIIYTPL